MKKITKYMLFAFALLLGFTVKATAVSAATLHQENTQYYYDRIHSDGSEHSWYFKHYTMDGEIAFCIEPGVIEGTTYSQGSYDATGLPNSIKERILLIGYYGYTSQGHQTEQYRAATQGILWDTITGTGTTKFTTARWGNGSILETSSERAEIFMANYDTSVGIPLGNLSSQWYALIYLDDLDRFIKEKLQIKGYVRYMDDFILIHSNKDYLRYCLKEIDIFCKEKLKVELNAKTQIGKVKKGIYFLGFRLLLTETGKVVKKLRSSSKIRFKRYLKNLKKLEKKE